MTTHRISISSLCQGGGTENSDVFLLDDDLIRICKTFAVCPSASLAKLRWDRRTGDFKAVPGIGRAKLDRDVSDLVWPLVSISSHAVAANSNAAQMENSRCRPNLNPLWKCDFPIDSAPSCRVTLFGVVVRFGLTLLQGCAAVQFDGYTFRTSEDAVGACLAGQSVFNERHDSAPWIHVVDALPIWMGGVAGYDGFSHVSEPPLKHLATTALSALDGNGQRLGLGLGGCYVFCNCLHFVGRGFGAKVRKVGPDSTPRFLTQHLPRQSPPRFRFGLSGFCWLHVSPSSEALIQILLVDVQLFSQSFAFAGSYFFSHAQESSTMLANVELSARFLI